MKRNILILIAALSLASCSDNFMDKTPLDMVSNQTYWNTEKEAVAAAIGCYKSWWSMDNVIYFDCTSDNAYNQYVWEGFQTQATGAATASDTGTDFFSYADITKCNNFLNNISRPVMDEALRKRLTAEVRFIRAWHYFIKVTLYGDVPLVTEVLRLEDSNVPRTPKADVIKFVLNELTTAAADLPESYTGNDVGRITKGAALSLKARMEIFDGKYTECAATCGQIMTLGYSLFPDYKGLFKIANEGNKEVILDVQYIENLYPNEVLGVLPSNSAGGYSSIDPTQSLVDAYECTDGKTIAESPLYDSTQPYKNRDPRLDLSIVRPGSSYNGGYYDPIDAENPTGDYYDSGNNCSRTGYTGRKYVDDLTDYSDMWNTGMNAIVIRYAEVLLMYAESKIELNSIDASVYDAIDQIRARAGMPAVDQSVYNTQTKLRELVRRERRVELALEGLRWFDICRWKIGADVMPGKVYGALEGTVSQTDGTLSLTNKRIEVETRTFDPATNYLWPIPQKVIDATPKITQNPNY